MHSLVEDHLRAAALLRDVLSHVRPGHLDAPTPCGTWRVRDLLAHQLGQDRAFTLALTGGTDDLDAWAPVPVGDDASTTLIDALAEQDVALRAFGDPDRRTIWMPEILPDRALPAARALGAHLIDLVVHSWDLAVSIDAPLDVPEDLVAFSLQVARAIPDTDQARGPGRAFVRALDVPTGATPFDEVLLLLGRDPKWQPPAG